MRFVSGLVVVALMAGLAPPPPAVPARSPSPVAGATALAPPGTRAAEPQQPAQVSSVAYAHDANGRVTGVFAEPGDGSKITHDASGNITEIRGLPAGTLALAQISPPSAAAGTTVTIYGTAFGTDKGAVSVSFGGASATPSAVTDHTITVAVPTGAAAGDVTVTVGGKSASWNGFKVIGARPKPAISLTGIRVADTGTEVALTGSGFDTDRIRNVTSLNGGKVQVTQATASGMTIKAPPGPAFGHVKIVNPAGSDVSAGDIVVPPAPYLAANIGAGGAVRLAPNTLTAVPVAAAQQIAIALFEVDAGKRTVVYLSGKTVSGCLPTRLYGPDGTALFNQTMCGATQEWDVPAGSPQGTYAVVIDPEDDLTGKVDVLTSQSADATAEVGVDGPEASLTTTVPGQQAVFTFSGTAGQRVFTKLGVPAGTKACDIRVSLRGPDGTELAKDTCVYEADAFSDTLALPADGVYRWIVDPEGVVVGTFRVTAMNVPADVAVSTSPDAGPAAVAIAKPGQNGSVSFSGTAGQRVFTRLTVPAGAPACALDVRLVQPDGAELVKDTCLYNATKYLDTVTLSADGTYTYKVNPKGAWTGTPSVEVLNVPADAAVSTSVDAAAVAVAIAKPGQNGSVTFSGTAGQRVFTKVVVPAGAPSCGLAVRLLRPDGAELAENTCLSQGNQYLDTVVLPADGTYTYTVNPKDAWTGSPTLAVTGVPADAAVSTSVDAAAVAVAIAKPGQNGSVTFSGTAGQRVFTKVTIPAGAPACALDVRLVQPSGAELVKDTCLYNAAEYFDTVTLPADGTYTYKINPKDAWTGSPTLAVTGVPADAAVTTSPDAAPVAVAIAKPGQNGSVTFTGATGKRVFTKLQISPVPPSCGIAVRLLKPDGTELAKNACISKAAEYLDTVALPADGAYTLAIDPKDAYSGTVTVTVVDVPADAQKSATVGGPDVAVTTTKAGQNAAVTFPVTAGQSVKITMVDETYAASCVSTELLPPTGARLWTSCMSKGTNRTTTLTAAGTYTFRINPADAETGTATVRIASGTAVAARADEQRTDEQRTDEQRTEKRSTEERHAEEEPGRTGIARRPEPETPPAQTVSLPGHVRRGKPLASFAPGKRAQAELTGVVKTTAGLPLPDVTLSADGRKARTDAKGAFRLTDLPQGMRTLRIDGRTASTGKLSYGVFDVRVPLKAGDNELFYTPYLPALDTDYEIEIPSPTTSEVVVSNPAVPGLEVRIPPGVTIEDADGKPVRRIGITSIPVDRTPIPMPDGVRVPVYYTVQPAGGRLVGGTAQITYPNYLKLPAGQRVNFWHYDKHGEGWEIFGAGKVDPPARQVVPDTGTRISDFDGAMINVPGNEEPAWKWLLKFLNSAGDPVELSTGLFSLSQTDLTVDDVLPLAVTRGYNPGDVRKRSMGIGSNDQYNMYLSSRKQYQEADLNFPDGSQVHYVRTSPGTGFCDAVFEARHTSPEFSGSRFSYVGACNKGGWHLKLRNGLIYVFGDEAPLQEIRDPQGNTVKIFRKYKNSFGSYLGPVTEVRSPNGFWLSYTHDTADRVTKVEDNAGRAVTYTYDGDRLKTVTGPSGRTTTYGYDAAGRMNTITDARGRTYLTNVYDTAGRVATQTILGQGSYTFAYTLSADASRVVAAQVTEPDGAVRKTTYDDLGYLSTDTQATGTGREHTIRISRDPATDLPNRIEDGLGRTTTIAYDASGNPEELKGAAGSATVTGRATYRGTPYGRPDTLTDPTGAVTRLGYDQRGNLEKLTDAQGRTWKTTYNGQGRPLTQTTPRGRVTTYGYADGALSTVTDPAGRETRFVRDAANRVIEIIAPDGTSTKRVYDESDVLRSVTDAAGDELAFDYDENGNVTSVKDGRGKITAYRYDDADRLVERTDPLGAKDTFAYDALNRLSTVTDRRGKVTEYRYDELGRTTFTGFGKNGENFESTLSAQYDARGRVRELTDSTPGAGKITYDYDDLDHLVTETSSAGAVGYTYDAAGRLKSMTASGQAAVAYDYFPNGLLKSVTRGAVSVLYGYDDDGRMTSKALPGGVAATYGYDDSGLLTSIGYKRDTTGLGEVAYDHDLLGRRVRTHGTLVRAQLPTAATGLTYDDANRLTGNGGRTLGYDPAGNLTSDNGFTYTWNARGELVSVSDGNATTTLGYDPAGRRVGSTTGTDVTRFRFDGDALIGQTGPGGADVSFLNGFGQDETLARVGADGQVRGLLPDALGSTMALTDGSGQITTTYGYDLFGTTTSSQADDPNLIRWTGRVSGAPIPGGLQDNRSRMYSPSLRRFISEDTIGFGGGYNLYEYALGDPVDHTDPDGTIPPQLAAAGGACVTNGIINTVAGALLGRKHSFGDYARGFGKGCFEGALGAITFGGTRFARFGKYGDEVVETAGKTCRITSSFVPGTKVRMADGSAKPIEEVAVGDRVLATDAATGRTGSQPVVATMTSQGAKDLVKVGVEGGGVIVATDNHPFWVPALKTWLSAGELRKGMWLRTSAGTFAQVSAVETEHRANQRVHNLSVEGPHTYHVVQGEADVLVHNSPRPKYPCGWMSPTEWANSVKREIRDKYRGDTGYESGRHGEGFKAAARELERFIKDHPGMLPEIEKELRATAKRWMANGRSTGHSGGW
ncbi:polymorphic toxin-type HINT domain-containing protein [Nonomuraea sp. NPDC049152]|uniref:polymorphic toxin-type HINT domain-containing protein n=1 Tax=Nonomuraea sp. NPDC049152 TaxID=3154350 RepID=UPI0033E32F26